MKKAGKMTAILTAAAVAVVTFAGCGTVTLTAAEPGMFDSVIEKWGYVTEDLSDEAAQEDGDALFYEAADLSAADVDGEIDYVLFADDTAAARYYETAKAFIESGRTGINVFKGVSGNMFGRYSATSGGVYRVISWIGNTCIYAETGSENKGVINDILDELGY